MGAANISCQRRTGPSDPVHPGVGSPRATSVERVSLSSVPPPHLVRGWKRTFFSQPQGRECPTKKRPLRGVFRGRKNLLILTASVDEKTRSGQGTGRVVTGGHGPGTEREGVEKRSRTHVKKSGGEIIAATFPIVRLPIEGVARLDGRLRRAREDGEDPGRKTPVMQRPEIETDALEPPAVRAGAVPKKRVEKPPCRSDETAVDIDP